MNALHSTVIFFLLGGILLGAGAGSFIGYRMGVQEGLAADISAREILASEVSALQTIKQQQQASLQTAEASINRLTHTIDEQQRAHEYDTRELALYRRIESGGQDKGIHVNEVELLDTSSGPVLRVTLLQLGSRSDVQGGLGVALIGPTLPGAENDRVVLASEVNDSTLEFDFRFMSRITVALPDSFTASSDSEAPFDWLGGLDMVELDIIPRDDRRRPKRVTIPADRMIVGPAE